MSRQLRLPCEKFQARRLKDLFLIQFDSVFIDAGFPMVFKPKVSSVEALDYAVEPTGVPGER